MVSIEECYRAIVGKEPVSVDKLALTIGILKVIKEEPRDVSKQFTCLFFVDLFESGWPDFCNIDESEILMNESITALKVYASACGCEDVEKKSITVILSWIINSIPIDEN